MVPSIYLLFPLIPSTEGSPPPCELSHLFPHLDPLVQESLHPHAYLPSPALPAPYISLCSCLQFFADQTVSLCSHSIKAQVDRTSCDQMGHVPHWPCKQTQWAPSLVSAKPKITANTQRSEGGLLIPAGRRTQPPKILLQY